MINITNKTSLIEKNESPETKMKETLQHQASDDVFKELVDKKNKLINMERELQAHSKEIDEKMKVLTKKEERIDKKINVLSSSETFRKIQDLLDEVFTLSTSHGLSSDDAFESLRLIWEARNKFKSI